MKHKYLKWIIAPLTAAAFIAASPRDTNLEEEISETKTPKAKVIDPFIKSDLGAEATKLPQPGAKKWRADPSYEKNVPRSGETAEKVPTFDRYARLDSIIESIEKFENCGNFRNAYDKYGEYSAYLSPESEREEDISLRRNALLGRLLDGYALLKDKTQNPDYLKSLTSNVKYSYEHFREKYLDTNTGDFKLYEIKTNTDECGDINESIIEGRNQLVRDVSNYEGSLNKGRFRKNFEDLLYN